MSTTPYIEQKVSKMITDIPQVNILIEPLILSEAQVSKLLACDVRKLRKIVDAGILTIRKNNQRKLYNRIEINQLLANVFDKDFPSNIKNPIQKKVLMELFMSDSERIDYLTRDIYKVNHGK